MPLYRRSEKVQKIKKTEKIFRFFNFQYICLSKLGVLIL